jgi:hypothetical protein
MKGLLFFLVLLGIITVAWSFSTKEGFQNAMDPGLNIPLISPRYQTLVKGEVQPFSPPSTSLLAPPPGQSASVTTRPDSDPAMQKVTAERIQSIYESIVGFFAKDAAGLQKIGDPSIQLPLSTTRGDRTRLKDELDTLKRNPGLESSLTNEDVDGIQANLGYLQKKWRMSTNALSGSPMEGFQSGGSSGTTTITRRARITGTAKTFQFGDKAISITGDTTITAGVPTVYTVSPVSGYPDWETSQVLKVAFLITDPNGNVDELFNTKMYTFDPSISGNYTIFAYALELGVCYDDKSCPSVSMTVNVINSNPSPGASTFSGSGITKDAPLSGSGYIKGTPPPAADMNPTMPGGSGTGGSTFSGSSYTPLSPSDIFPKMPSGSGTGGSIFSGSGYTPLSAPDMFPKMPSGSGSGTGNSSNTFTSSNTGSGSDVTLQDLEELSMRIGLEIVRLQSSGAADSFVDINLQSRINTLVSMKKTIDDLIAEVKSGARKLKDVPLTKAAIARFLPAMANPNTSLPNLIKDNGASKYLNNLFPTFAAGDISGAILAQKLFNKYEDQLINNLSWDVSVKYTSQAEQQVAANNAMVAGTYGYIPEDGTSPYTKADEGGYRGFLDSLVNKIGGKGGKRGQGGQPQGHQTTGNDSPSLPGNPGSLDWKDRSKQICAQIKARGYEPYDFGCLQNPDAMNRESFSWRGYTKMVCSRLSTIYDSSVPELCGCPPTDWPGWRQ